MNNDHLRIRLAGVLTMLKGVYEASGATPNATKGAEREAFVDGFLGAVLPPTTRIGNGAITDQHSERSGQLDVVVEYPILPSVPIWSELKSRLYLAEGVAAAIEVKSDLGKQWDEVKKTASALAKLRRNFGGTSSTRNRHPSECVPLIAIGYKGWQNKDTIKDKVQNTDGVHGILDISLGFFYAQLPFVTIVAQNQPMPAILKYEANGEDALWGLICVLNEQVNNLSGMKALASHYTFNNLAK